ncbi:hypothetical protein Bca52824_052771 [Brassica carinata]|uniref:RRM domain-containing protein n=1 Tax=Brassica carinata TaxID=52824 RepID=A0A8X7UL37_BRACI|nr:hypothetical protein Bca52824_052771 [Brassica carinata]
MTSCSQRANLLGKRKPEDGLRTEPVLKKHKEKFEKEIEARVGLLSDEANSVTVETEPILKGHREEKETAKGFSDEIKGRVELLENEASLISVEGLDESPEKAAVTVETEPILKGHREEKETAKGFSDEIKGRVELLENEASLISVEGLDESPEKAAELKKTLFVAHLPPQTKISDIIRFFKDVGQVVRVLLQATHKGKCVGEGFVEFASANQAKKALEKKKNEYLHKRKIFLDVAHKGALCLPPKYCIDHKVWYQEDYLQQESFRIQESPKFSEEATVLFIANLSPQTTKILHIINFLEDVGDVVSVRLIVNHEGKHVGCGFVEFASANQAKKALENKNGEYLHDHKILLMKRRDETPNVSEAVATVRNKTICVTHFSGQTKISDIINFFKDIGQVVHVRLIVNPKIKHVRLGFVEFASANEAEKALEKNGEYFINIFKCIGEVVRVRLIVDHRGESLGCGFVEFASAEEAKKAVQEKSGCAIYVKVAEKAPYFFRPKCNLADLAEKLWYEDKLRREGFGLPSKSELRKEEAVFCGNKITFSDKD